MPADDDHRPAAERSPGRPREPEVDQRILDAAMRLMAQDGFVRMSMGAVAEAAGVTKPTIYRRYPSKIELALAAIVAYCDKAPVHLTGDTRADLVAQLQQFRFAMDRPHGMAMLGTMLAEEHTTPELLQAFRESLVYPRRAAIQAIIALAYARGELRPETNLLLLENMLVGAYYAQYLSGVPFAPDWAEQLVDLVLPAHRHAGVA